MHAFLYEVTPTDSVAIGGAILALVISGVLANWLPARRASQVDSVDALQAE